MRHYATSHHNKPHRMHLAGQQPVTYGCILHEHQCFVPARSRMEKCEGVEKLDMDLLEVSGRHVRMDEDNTELTNLLCTRIGTIMEDASFLATTIGAVPAEEKRARIAELQRASASIAALTAAVSSLA